MLPIQEFLDDNTKVQDKEKATAPIKNNSKFGDNNITLLFHESIEYSTKT